ncbi:MAG: heme-copper oxidase subunit III [Anaerolineaceae bacterium]|nr:heme-copper oxidase subunit III [Anaerolineaceae bacterium]
MSEITVEQTHHEEAADHGHASPQARAANLKLAMWLYLGSEVIIFSVLIAAYLVFRYNFPEMVRAAQESINVGLVGFNTFLLLGSSWAMVMGLLSIQRGDRAGLVRWIGLTALMGAVFVALQGVEYTELGHEGIAVYGSEFGMRFYAMTAFHGFHVIIGVLWALFVVRNAQRGNYSADNYVGVEIFGLYWHFVDVVWIFLFTFIYLF